MAESDVGGTKNDPSPPPAPMEGLPSERELELEILVKERDEYITRLANEIRLLRRRLPQSEETSKDEPFALLPSATNLLLPLLSKSSLSNAAVVGASGHTLNGLASATVTAALTARLAALHKENEELYELLKRGAVGRLREETRELRLTARKLEDALQESHTIISQLKTELEESYRAIERQGESFKAGVKRQSRSRSPINHYKQRPQPFTGRQTDTKPIPTGPRAFKKQRLSHPNEELPASSGYRAEHQASPPVAFKQEEDSRMKVEDDDYEVPGSGGKDNDRYSDYNRAKSEQYSQYSRSRSPTPKRLGSDASDWDRPKSRSRSRSQGVYARSPSPRRSPVRRDSYASEYSKRSPSRSPAPRSRSRSVDPLPRSPTPPSPDVDETHTNTRSYSRTRSSVHSPVSRRRSLSRTRSSPRSTRRHSRSPPRHRRSPTPDHSPPRRSRSPSRLRIQGAARRLEDRRERERSLRPPSPARQRGGDRRPSPRDIRAERERERGHHESKGRNYDRDKEHRGGLGGGNSDSYGNGRRRRQGKAPQRHGGGGGGHASRNGSHPGSTVGSLASRIK